MNLSRQPSLENMDILQAELDAAIETWEYRALTPKEQTLLNQLKEIRQKIASLSYLPENSSDLLEGIIQLMTKDSLNQSELFGLEVKIAELEGLLETTEDEEFSASSRASNDEDNMDTSHPTEEDDPSPEDDEEGDKYDSNFDR